MANLVSGKLPPPEGMTYEVFREYSLYLALREFLRVHQGVEEMRCLDASYALGSKINSEALLKHPMGRTVAALGRAMHEGGVLPGWNNTAGTMQWAAFSRFVRWFARLNRQQQVVAIARIRGGCDAPWELKVETIASQAGACPIGEGQTGNPSVPGGDVGKSAETASSALALAGSGNVGMTTKEFAQMQNASDSSGGIGIAGWLAIIAALVGVGFMIYKMFDQKTEQPNPEQETP